MSLNTENFNLHIEKTSEKDSFKAVVKDEKKNILAENTFRYQIDSYILSRLEDSIGENVRGSSKIIN